MHRSVNLSGEAVHVEGFVKNLRNVTSDVLRLIESAFGPSLCGKWNRNDQVAIAEASGVQDVRHSIQQGLGNDRMSFEVQNAGAHGPFIKADRTSGVVMVISAVPTNKCGFQ